MNSIRTPWLVAVGLSIAAVAIGCGSDNDTPDQDAGQQDTGVGGSGGGAAGQGGKAGQGGSAAGGQGGDAGAGGGGGSGQGGAGGSAGTGGSGGGDNPPECRTDADCENSGADDGEHCRPDGRCASKIFETVWNIPDSERTLVLPYYDDKSGTAKCDFTILWGDEGAGSDFNKGTRVTDCSTKSNITHTYAAAGTYHVKIKGVYNGWGVEPLHSDIVCEDDCDGHVLVRLAEMVRFGSVGLTERAFACTNGVKLPAGEIPDANLWHNGRQMFRCAGEIGEAISRWDTSNVTNMSWMFYRAAAFNQPLNSWDTSNVTNMRGMFDEAAAFNQPLNNWDTSNVTDMSLMFNGAATFNQPLNNWDTSNVTNMWSMFNGAATFNQPLNNWDTSNVTNMWGMFAYAAAFDQNLALWNVTNVTDMERIFSESGITQPNYCAVKSLPVWKNASLGVSFDCP